MKHLSAVLLATVLLATGCGGDSHSSDMARTGSSTGPGEGSTSAPAPGTSTPSTPSTVPTAEPTSEPSQASDPAARRTLRQAQLALLGADTGSVRTLAVLGPNSIDTHAAYQITTSSMSAHITLSGDEDAPLTTDAIAIGRDVWFRLRQGGDDPKQTCWMSADNQALEEATGADLPGGGRGTPAGLLVAANARAVSQLDDSRMLATIDLYTGASAFTGKLPITLGIDFHTKDTVPVTIYLSDGEITGWRLTFFDLLHAVEDAGVQLPAEFEGYEDQDLSHAHVTADFSDLGHAVVVEPPPADLVVQLSGDAEQFAEDREACDARVN